jgi:hypothetical protein
MEKVITSIDDWYGDTITIENDIDGFKDDENEAVIVITIREDDVETCVTLTTAQGLQFARSVLAVGLVAELANVDRPGDVSWTD